MESIIFSQEVLKPDRPLELRDGTRLEAEVLMRRSRLYPGHISLISEQRLQRTLPAASRFVKEEKIDPKACRFCHPDTLCAEGPNEQTSIHVEGREFILALNPYYYLPGHGILFPKIGPHLLEETGSEDWFHLLSAGVKAASQNPDFRLGFNAGTYLCCGGSQRHLHLQLVPMNTQSPAEQALSKSMQKGVTYKGIRKAFEEKGLILEEDEEEEALLAACWAPRFNLELLAIFSRSKRFHELGVSGIICLSDWIYKVSRRFVVPQGGGINGFGLEVPGLPFIVRIIPRLPGGVQAFMETGAGYMVISYLPEAIPRIWKTGLE